MPRQLTNKKELPLPLYLAIKNDQYEARGHISTTTLIDAPLPRILKKYNSYEEDAAEMIWSLYGQAVHAIIERIQVGQNFTGSAFMPEEKLLIKTTGNLFPHEIELSGTSDLIEIKNDKSVVLHDFKNVFVYTVKQGVSSPSYKKWTLQLNIYKYLIKQCLNLDVNEIQVHAFVRDWNRSKSEYTEGYPEFPVETFQIPKYNDESILKYIKSRIDLHFPQEADYKVGKEIPHCSEEDRWARPEVWKMMKLGGKRSLKNFVIKDDGDRTNAKAYFATKSQEVPTLVIEVVPGEDVRCVNYCPVNKFCRFYKEKYGTSNTGTEKGAGVIELKLAEVQVPVEPKPDAKVVLKF